MLKLRNKLLILAIITATLTRFWKISTLPYPPNGDELAFGYYGWSLLHFGTDEYGRILPLNFPSIGDFKYPALAYLNIIPAVIFGLNEITTRFWSAISGVLLVLITYKLSKLIFKNEIAALASSWLVALSPWSILESRLGYENHISMFLTTLSLTILLHIPSSIIPQLKKNKLVLISLLLLVISAFTYGAQRIFIPLILLSIIILSYLKNSFLTKTRKISVIFFITLTLIIGISLVPQGSRGRAFEEAWKGLTGDQSNRLQELYIQAGTSQTRLPARLTYLFHNKYRVTTFDFLQRYSNHFSPNFLFFYGEASTEKIPDMGLLLFIEILLLPIGLFTLFLNKNKEGALFVLTFLIFAPVASSLTFGGPHINRASLMIPPIALISGLGFANIVNSFKGKTNKLALYLLALGISGSSLFTLNQLFIQKPMDKPWIKEQVHKEVVKEIYKIKNKYKAVAVNDDDYIYFLFYEKISPKTFLSNSEITPLTKDNVWERVDRLENIYFKMPFNCPKSGKLGVLYVCSGQEVPQNSKVLNVFYFWDGVPANTFIEFYPLSKMPSKLPELPENIYYMVDVETGLDYPDGIIPDNFPSLW